MENSKYCASGHTETMALPSLGFLDKATLGQSWKIDLQRRKWGSMPRND
jgi:hypothetical protein